MPSQGTLWRHVMINTHCSWLKGDRRGFRSKHHEIHSSGNYKNPPPEKEHAGLRRYFEQIAGPEVHIEFPCRSIIGKSILNGLRLNEYQVLAIAVGKVHAHFLVKLPDDMRVVNEIVGELKRKSSRAVKKQIPGKVWSRGSNPKRVETKQHLRKAHDYILYEQGRGAWTWSFKDNTDDGVMGRCRPALRSGRP